MVTDYGMSDRIGMVAGRSPRPSEHGSGEGPRLFDEMAAIIHEEVRRLLDNARRGGGSSRKTARFWIPGLALEEETLVPA